MDNIKRIIAILFIHAFIATGVGFSASLTQTTIGYSYVELDDNPYQALEIGTSIVLITKDGIVRPYAGIEVSMPLFFDSDEQNIQNIENESLDFGVALQTPLVFGLEIGGFYIQAMGGYSLSWLSQTTKIVHSGIQNSETKTTKKNISQGFIYGGGIGYNFNSNFTIGVRYIKGSMKNEIINESPTNKINKKYKSNYTKGMVLLGYSY